MRQGKGKMKKEKIRKFELTPEFITKAGKKLFRIKALVTFGNVKKGELGGFVEKEENLCHIGNCWVSDDAWIFENAGYTVVKGFGSENRTTTFFLTKDKKVGAQCGCFYGTLEEFRRKVKETHKDTQFAKEYLMIADLMELHFIPLVDHLVIEE